MGVTRHHSGRGRGRPKKGEFAVRKMTKHNFEKMKPERRMGAIKETIATANALYARFSQPYPNPLNIDEKDLDPDAKACWEYLFSTRGYRVDEIKDRTGAVDARPRVIESPDEVIFAFECYLNWIRKQNFVKGFVRPDGTDGVMPIIPNQSNFAKWLGLPAYIISRAMMEANAETKDIYKRRLADCLSEGAMVGAYNTASTIFTLKNMCDWADKYEDRSTNRADDLGVAEAEELMKQLGYAREKAKLEPPKPMLEGDSDG